MSRDVDMDATDQAGPSTLINKAAYLASAPVVIKALKGPQDPPEVGWPSKIEIATEAWEDSGLYMLRKAEFLRDWILESWTRAPGKGKGKAVTEPTLLKSPYYELLLSLPLETTIVTSPLPPVQPIVTAFYSTLCSSSAAIDPKLLSLAHRTFAKLLDLSSSALGGSGVSSSKAEAWLDTWRMMLVWLSGVPVLTDKEVVQEMLKMVVHEVMDGLSLSQNRKKISQMIVSQDMAALLSVWNRHTELRSQLQTLLGPLFFPIPILQTINSFASTTNAIISQASTKDRSAAVTNGLSILPKFLASYISSLQSVRYTVFPPPATARADVPADVYISTRVRAAVLTATSSALTTIKQLGSANMQSSDGVDSWKAISAVWTAVHEWGGYFEGEAGWPALLASTISQAVEQLVKLETVTNITMKRTILAMVATGLKLDYAACENVQDGKGLMKLLAGTLLVGSDVSEQATDILSAVLQYHILTHSLPAYFRLITTSVIEAMSHPETEDAAQKAYRNIAVGPLFGRDINSSIGRALESSFTGGVEMGPGWGLLVQELCQEMAKLLEEAASTSGTVIDGSFKKKRKMDGAGTAASTATPVGWPSATYGLLSRLLQRLLLSAIGKGPSAEHTGVCKDVIAILEQAKAAWETSSTGAEVNPSRKRSQVPWREEILEAGQLRVLAAASKLGWEATSDVTASGHSEGELAYESIAATCLQDEMSIAQVEQILQILERPAKASPIWAGRIADVNGDVLQTAIWWNIAQRGLRSLDTSATGDQLGRLAQILMAIHDITSDVSEQQSMTEHGARARILQTAETWELEGLRPYLLRVISTLASSSTSTTSSWFALIRHIPVDFLSKATRATLVEKALGVLLGGGTDDRLNALVFIDKVAEESSYIAPLSSDAVTLLRFIDAYFTYSTAEEQRIVLSILGYAFEALLRGTESESDKAMLMVAVKHLRKTVKLTSPVTLKLMEIARSVYPASDSVPAALRKLLVELCQQTQKFYLADLKVLINDKQETRVHGLVTAWTSCFRSASWLTVSNTESQMAPKLLMRLLSTPTDASAIGPCVLDLLTVEQESTASLQSGASIWFAAFIAILMKSLEPSSKVFDSCFRRRMADLTPETYASLLEGAAEDLGSSLGDRLAVVMVGVRLLLGLDIAGVGKVIRNALPIILESVSESSARYENVGQLEGSLSLMETIVTERSVQLQVSDVTDICNVCHAAFSPSSTTRSTTTNVGIFKQVLTIINTLVRQRRDLVAAALPHFIAVLSKAFTLLCRPRHVSSAGAASKAALDQLPAWISATGPWLQRSEAQALAKCFVTLTSRTTIRKGKATTPLEDSLGVRGDKASDTLVGPLSKHVPALLVAYVRAIVNPIMGIPIDVRQDLESGIHALCEAVVAGGKAQFGKSDGFANPPTLTTTRPPQSPTSNIPSSAKSPPVAPRSIPAQGRSGGRGVTSPRSNFGSLDSKLSNSFGERFNHFEQLAELESEDMTLDKGDDEVEEMLFSVQESVPPPQTKSGPLITYSRVELLRWSKSKLCQMPKGMPGFDLWYGEMSAKSPISATRDGRQGGNGGMPRSAPGTSAEVGNDSEGGGFGRGFGSGLGRGQASSGRPRQTGFRRPDLSPTAVKSPVDADGHHSYFSTKSREGQETPEGGDGMQMGRFVKKSALRIGGDELNRSYQSDGRTRGPHTPRGGREGGHHSEGRELREKSNSEVTGGWRKGAALTGGVGPVPDRHERERERKWNPPASQGHRDRDGHRGGADDRVPEWMADDSAPSPMSSKRRGEANESLGPEQTQRKSGLAALQIGVDAIAQYKIQMKEKEMRSRGLLDRDDGESRPGMPDSMPLSDPAIQSQSANAREGDASTSAPPPGMTVSASFLLPAPKGRSSGEPTNNSGSGGRGSRFAKFFDGGAPAPPPGLAHQPESNISYGTSNTAMSPPPIDAHKQGLAALLSMGVDVKVPSGIAASAPYARPPQQQDMPAPSAQLPPHIISPPPGLLMSQMLAPPPQGGDGRSAGQKNGGTQPDEHMSRLLGMLKVATPSATPSPQPPNAMAMPSDQDRHSQHVSSPADRPQSQQSQPMYSGRQTLQPSGPPGLGPQSMQGPSRMQASYQNPATSPQQQGSPVHSRQPSQTPQPQSQSHQQGPDPRFMPPGMMAPHGGFPDMHPNSQNSMNAAAFQQQMLMRQMAAAGFNPAQSPPGPPGMQGMPFHFGPGPGGPPQAQQSYPMPPHNMPPQFGQPPFGMMPPQFREGPPPPPGMGGPHPQPDLMAMLLQGGQR